MDMGLEQVAQITGLSAAAIKMLLIYNKLAIFLGAFILSESVILAFSFFSAQGYFSVIDVFIFSFLGAVACDFFWFLLGRYAFKFVLKIPFFGMPYDKFCSFMRKISGKKQLSLFLLFKFLYALQPFVIVYFATFMPLKRFLKYECIAVSIWLSIIVSIGWLAGRGAYYLIEIYRGFNYSLLAVISLIIIVKFFQMIARKSIKI